MSTNKTSTTVKVFQDGVENHLVGMTEEQALRTLALNDTAARVAVKDGKKVVYNMLLWKGVYLYIEHGKVVKATRR